MGNRNLPEVRHQSFNVSVIQQVLHGNHPDLFRYLILGVKEGRYFP